ncbi:sialidase family protein [Nonomuraea typhae]|uniref:sialidase family protein n=1 Tax=Nonomuraea typhae TaxID=2603600 RepID=UPI0012FB8226|nr:sialidase family protein [Nonomuraea typhae]
MRHSRALGMLAATSLVLVAFAVPAQGAGFGYDDLTPLQKRLASGTFTEALAGHQAARIAAGHRPAADDCDGRIGGNIKVNQNCQNPTDTALHGRGQAQNETWIAANPFDARTLVAAYNDYRRGDGTCGLSYSRDGGHRWTDATVPSQFVTGTAFGKPRQYWQGGGDPSVAWDSRGNAYLSCLHFNRGAAISPNPDASSGLYLYRSTTGGASWTFSGRPTVEHADPEGDDGFLHDKQLMAVDASVTSRFRDRIYVTWTKFDSDGTAYIMESHSADFGETFSPAKVISTGSPLCTNTFGLPTPAGTCNVNQFSQPVTAPDGSVYVVWDNYNNTVTGADNRNQILLAKSADGGVTWGAPVKVGDFYDLPDCLTYQNANAGRACVPEKGATQNSVFRAANYPYVAVNPKSPAKVSVGYGSYISRNSRESKGCTPAGFSATTGINLYDGVKSGGCNNDIVLSESTDGGATFTGGAADVRTLPSLTDRPGQRTTDQYFHGLDYSPTGKLVAAYYDRQYGTANATGFSDVSLTVAGSFTRRVTTSSMPPASQFAGGFFGDYIFVDATATHAFPIWSDTRPKALFICAPAVCTAPAPNADPANDQEIAVAREALS